MRYAKITVTFVAVAVVTGLFLVAQKLGQDTRPNIEQLPRVTVHRLDRGTIDFAALRGRPVLVTFWSITCVTCIKEIPHFVELYRAYNHQGLEVIGVSGPQDLPHRVLEFVRDVGIPYPIALDVEAKAGKAFGGVYVTPTTFLFAPNGKLVFKKTGPFDKVHVARLVQEMLSRDTGENMPSANDAATSGKVENKW
jgi:peroxiredoxin